MKPTVIDVWDKFTLEEREHLCRIMETPMAALALVRIESFKGLVLPNPNCHCLGCETATKMAYLIDPFNKAELVTGGVHE